MDRSTVNDEALVPLGGSEALAQDPPVLRPVPQQAVEAPEPRSERPTTLPTEAAFTEERMLRDRKAAPRSGWRRSVYAATGGAVNLGPSSRELDEFDLIARVKAPITGSRRVAVISRKGGVGKTSTVLGLGHTFAAHRGDRVVALDGNPDAGSLAYRVRRETAATVTSLLADRDRIERYSDVRGYTSQAPTRLEVVASDNDPTITQALAEADYLAAIDVLDRHYNLILCDTGTGILDSGIQGILAAADQLVVVMPPALDGARVASGTLDWLEQHGYGRLVGEAVAVVNAVRPTRPLLALEQVTEHFAGRCRQVVTVPFDAHLEAGTQTSVEDLRPATRRAYLQLAAAVADGFDRMPDREHRTDRERLTR